MDYIEHHYANYRKVCRYGIILLSSTWIEIANEISLFDKYESQTEASIKTERERVSGGGRRRLKEEREEGGETWVELTVLAGGLSL